MTIYIKNKKGLSRFKVICIMFFVVISIVIVLVPSARMLALKINEDSAIEKSKEIYEIAVYVSSKSSIATMEMAYYDGTHLITYDKEGKYTISLKEAAVDAIANGFEFYTNSKTSSAIYNFGKKVEDIVSTEEIEKCAFKISY
ncbi:MAG: hypothetical protein RSB96_00935 [Oscillospiraceae bacterium]